MRRKTPKPPESERDEYEEEELDEVRSELQQKTAELESVTQQLSEAVTEIEHLKRELPQEKERYKQLWRMSCANLVYRTRCRTSSQG